MKVIYGIGRLKKRFKKPVVAIGVFDGLHRGHCFLIRQMVKKAKNIKGTSMVMTFSPHPVHTLKPRAYLPFLVSLKHRLKLINQMDVDVCVVVNFTKAFSDLKPQHFIEKYLIKTICPHAVFIGQNFQFGKKQAGNASLLKKLGRQNNFHIKGICSVKSGHKVISSTRIRRLIVGGKIQQAARLLGRPVSILGRVKKGDGRGRLLGFPTANVNPFREVVPPCGVYAVKVEVGKKILKGMANVGFRPTFKKSGKVINMEVHIFDFHRNIYGREIEVRFIRKIRNEKKFPKNDQFIRQLKQDERRAKTFLK